MYVLGRENQYLTNGQNKCRSFSRPGQEKWSSSETLESESSLKNLSKATNFAYDMKLCKGKETHHLMHFGDLQ